MGNCTLPASLILRVLGLDAVQHRQVQFIDPDLARHQLVQQSLEQFFQYRPLLAVQIDLAVDGIQNGDDLALLV